MMSVEALRFKTVAVLQKYYYKARNLIGLKVYLTKKNMVLNKYHGQVQVHRPHMR